MDILEQRFDEVVAKLKALPSEGPAQPSNELKLKLYGLFRQAQDGDAEGRRPSPFDPSPGSNTTPGRTTKAWRGKKRCANTSRPSKTSRKRTA